MDRSIIYTIGDSHAWHCWLKVKDTAPCTVGPMTLYRFGQSRPIMTEKIPMDAVVCFCWGEIDCRCHVFKHQPWEDCIDKLSENYLGAIKLNVVGRDPKKVWVYNVVPPPRRDVPEGRLPENPFFPFRGSDAERRFFVNRLNKRLSEFPYKFINVYSQYSDDDGFLLLSKSDDGIHVSDPEPLEDWIHANS